MLRGPQHLLVVCSKNTRHEGLVGFATPLLGRLRLGVPREMNIDVSCARSLPHIGRCPRDRSRKGLLPLTHMCVVKLIG